MDNSKAALVGSETARTITLDRTGERELRFLITLSITGGGTVLRHGPAFPFVGSPRRARILPSGLGERPRPFTNRNEKGQRNAGPSIWYWVAARSAGFPASRPPQPSVAKQHIDDDDAQRRHDPLVVHHFFGFHSRARRCAFLTSSSLSFPLVRLLPNAG